MNQSCWALGTWSSSVMGKPRVCLAGLQRAEDFLDQRACLSHRILANGDFFFTDCVEQAIERLRSDIVVEVSILRPDQTDLRRFAGVLIVQSAQFHLRSRPGDDGLEPSGQLRAGRLLEVLRRGGVTAGQNAL